MKLNCIKLNCSECCKRYWITLLPAEAKKIAKGLNLSEKRFVESKCLLIAHIYHRTAETGSLTINSELLPSKAAEFVEREIGAIPPYFLVLPSLAIKRDSKGACVFLHQGRCEIHGIAPAICRLFPFVAQGKSPLRKVYPFCIALQQKKFGEASGGLDEKQKKRVNQYFDSVGKHGFSGQWRHLPRNGIVLLEGELELPISKKEFMQLIAPLL